MKRIGFLALIGIFVTTFMPIGQASDVSVGKMPPVVVKTFPESGGTNVDPSISEIRVTFSKEMMERSWSWVQMTPHSFPKLIGSPRYLEDKRTCVVNVELEPGKTYVIWLNSDKFRNFRDKDGRPSLPYLLVFETRK